MKIALLTDGIFPYVIGGMQRHSFYLVKYLAGNGYHVELYHMNQSNLDIHQLDVFTPEERLYIRSFVVPFPEKGKSPGHYIRESYEYSRRIFQTFRTNTDHVDFIIAKGFSGWELLHQRSKGFKCAPIGVNFHGYEMFQRQPSLRAALQSRFLLRSPVLYNIRNADYVFSYGGKITEIIKRLEIADAKIIELPTGIGQGWLNHSLNNSSNVRKFVFLGRYERRKGIEELSKVVKDVLRNLTSGLEFHFVGPIPESKKMKDMRIHYHGSISDSNQVRQILQQSEVLVCPSHSEGMPNVIIEAMASGCAIIGTDVGAISCMVNRETGWLIRPNDAGELKKALQDAISISPNALDKKRKAATELVEKSFLWENIILQLTDELQKRIPSI
jgi:glycosyltransferase involved in cell wall biosynthesis